MLFQAGDPLTIPKPRAAFRKLREDDVFLLTVGLQRLVCKLGKTPAPDWRLLNLEVIRTTTSLGGPPLAP